MESYILADEHLILRLGQLKGNIFGTLRFDKYNRVHTDLESA